MIRHGPLPPNSPGVQPATPAAATVAAAAAPVPALSANSAAELAEAEGLADRLNLAELASHLQGPFCRCCCYRRRRRPSVVRDPPGAHATWTRKWGPPITAPTAASAIHSAIIGADQRRKALRGLLAAAGFGPLAPGRDYVREFVRHVSCCALAVPRGPLPRAPCLCEFLRHPAIIAATARAAKRSLPLVLPQSAPRYSPRYPPRCEHRRIPIAP